MLSVSVLVQKVLLGEVTCTLEALRDIPSFNGLGAPYLLQQRCVDTLPREYRPQEQLEYLQP